MGGKMKKQKTEMDEEKIKFFEEEIKKLKKKEKTQNWINLFLWFKI